MGNNYIPGPDGDFHAWQNDFVTYVNAHLADLGLAAGDVAPINTAETTWTTDYPAHTPAQAARQAKDDARGGLEGAIRPLVGTKPGDSRSLRMRLTRRISPASVLLVACLALFFSGCAPKTFVRSAPGWKTIELNDALVNNYDEAWQKSVDTIARNWDIEILDKDSGYLRTAWVYGISGGPQPRYRGRITVKYPEIKTPTKAEVKTAAEWWASGNVYAPVWVQGFDSAFQRDVYSELAGRLGRTVPSD